MALAGCLGLINAFLQSYLHIIILKLPGLVSNVKL